jgi:hypothetical protein
MRITAVYTHGSCNATGRRLASATVWRLGYGRAASLNAQGVAHAIRRMNDAYVMVAPG